MRINRPGSRRLSRVMAALAAIAVLSGCTATGGGWIPSNDPTQRATLGFSFTSSATSPDTTTFSGSYHDPRGQVLDPLGGGAVVVDVDFKGTGRLHPCTPSDPRCATAPLAKGGCLLGDPTYLSQNPRLPGGGTFFVVVCDLDGNGVAGVEGEDSIDLFVDSGPYTGYVNTGNPSGNITVKN
jgi:hypothetical protein